MRSSPFANSLAGLQIWITHKQGYKFCEYIGDLTPLQSAFILACISWETRSGNQVNDDPQDDRQRIHDDIERKIREKRSQRQWQQ